MYTSSVINLHHLPSVGCKEKVNAVVLQFDLFVKICVYLSSNYSSAICEHNYTQELSQRETRGHPLGKHIISALIPDIFSASTSFRHCVDLPTLSQPSNTISAPLRAIARLYLDPPSFFQHACAYNYAGHVRVRAQRSQD